MLGTRMRGKDDAEAGEVKTEVEDDQDGKVIKMCSVRLKVGSLGWGWEVK